MDCSQNIPLPSIRKSEQAPCPTLAKFQRKEGRINEKYKIGVRSKQQASGWKILVDG